MITVDTCNLCGSKDRQLFDRRIFKGFEVTNWMCLRSEFDLALLIGHGIRNENTCAEGFTSGDDYLVVQSEPEAASLEIKLEAAVDMSAYHKMATFGRFAVYKRGTPKAATSW